MDSPGHIAIRAAHTQEGSHMSVREDGRLMCRPPCRLVIPKKAKAGYTCKCGKRHLFMPMWPCCGKYQYMGTTQGDTCPWCMKARTRAEYDSYVK